MRFFQLLKANREAVILTLFVNLAFLAIVLLILGSLFATFVGWRVPAIEGYGTEENAQSSYSTLLSSKVPAEESRIVEIVERVNPAVVSIVVSKPVARPTGGWSPWGELFGPDFDIPGFREENNIERQVGGGSGFIISEDGHVVTNRHVVEDESASYSILMNDGKIYEADIVAKDAVADIAILKIDSKGSFSYLEFGDSDALKPGQTVIAIGNALGEFQNSISVGVVSGLSRSVLAGDIRGNVEQLEEVIQTDAAINSGNSGGPLLDIEGRVIGINVAMALGSENIGFALPSNLAKSIADSVTQYGEIVRPYIGIRYVQVNEIIREENNLSVDYGALVLGGVGRSEQAVVSGSPADRAGIKEHDVILSIDGVPLKDRSLSAVIRSKAVGDRVSLSVLRDNKMRNVEVVLEKAP